MRKVEFDPAKLPAAQKKEWDKWQRRALKATEAIIKIWERSQSMPVAAGTVPKKTEPDDSEPIGEKRWKSKVWTDYKDWLLKNIFDGKCAYCETEIARFSVHAEHWRPKGRVTASHLPDAPVAQTRDYKGSACPHPGYFWLAYHWQNLLPSCEFCNTSGGKHDQFPAASYVLLAELNATGRAKLRADPTESPSWHGQYYLGPEDLDNLEDPQLLNPYRDEPRDHLRFGDCGLEVGREGSQKASTSITVYNLKEDRLRKARFTAQHYGLLVFQGYYGNAKGSLDDKWKAACVAFSEYITGKQPFSCAICDYVELNYNRPLIGRKARNW
jgi:hypothetical protein